MAKEELRDIKLHHKKTYGKPIYKGGRRIGYDEVPYTFHNHILILNLKLDNFPTKNPPQDQGHRPIVEDPKTGGRSKRAHNKDLRSD